MDFGKQVNEEDEVENKKRKNKFENIIFHKDLVFKSFVINHQVGGCKKI